jgi:hypothetical protein
MLLLGNLEVFIHFIQVTIITELLFGLLFLRTDLLHK